MSFIHLVCGGAGTVPVDSGLPGVGELYGVEMNGDLRWYRYDGSGQFSPDGSLGWAHNSRNVIGNGWNGFKFLCGGGDGIEDRAGSRKPHQSRNPCLAWRRSTQPAFASRLVFSGIVAGASV